jgi:nucleoside phosphorylase
LLAILTFVPQEAAPLLRRLSGRRRLASQHRPILAGEFAGTPVALTIAGAGAANAVRGLRALIDAGPVTGVAVCGVAGGLDPALRVGEVILASEIRRGSEVTTCPLPNLTPIPTGQSYLRAAPVASAEQVLVTREQKRAYAAAGAAVDMETAAVAAEAAQLGLPWCALRAISDAASEDLPLDFNRCVTPDGDIPLARVLLELARHPGALPGLIRLGRSTSLAAGRLAEAAEAYLPGWYASLR